MVEARCLLVMSGRRNEGRMAVANRLREITWNLDTFEEGYRTKDLPPVLGSFAPSRSEIRPTKNQTNGRDR